MSPKKKSWKKTHKTFQKVKVKIKKNYDIVSVTKKRDEIQDDASPAPPPPPPPPPVDLPGPDLRQPLRPRRQPGGGHLWR